MQRVTNLDPRLWQVYLHGHLFSHEYIRIPSFGKEFFENFQLRLGKRRPLPSLLSWVIYGGGRRKLRRVIGPNPTFAGIDQHQLPLTFPRPLNIDIPAYSTHKNLAVRKIMDTMRTVHVSSIKIAPTEAQNATYISANSVKSLDSFWLSLCSPMLTVGLDTPFVELAILTRPGCSLSYFSRFFEREWVSFLRLVWT